MKRLRVVYEPAGAAREYAALAVNLYDGCPHGCTYCYVPGILRRTREEFHEGAMPRNDILAKLESDCTDLWTKHDAREILLCFTCDPYPMGFDSTTTRQALAIMGDYGLKATVLTKNGKDARRDFDLLKQHGFRFGTTIGNLDQKTGNQIEPNAGLVVDRVQALAEAHAAGIRTWVSVEPVLDPEEALWAMEYLRPFVDEWKVGKWNHSEAAGKIDWKKFLADARRVLAGSNVVFKKALLDAAGE